MQSALCHIFLLVASVHAIHKDKLRGLNATDSKIEPVSPAAKIAEGIRKAFRNNTGIPPFKVVGRTGVAETKENLPSSFSSYYAGVEGGRGIWKWNNALVAYDRHLKQFQGKSSEGVEIGVQSGGSLDMWHKVLGEKAHIHGVDINPKCANFADVTTSITIGDGADPKVWESFFEHVTPSVDFVIDDGGHIPNQMLQTFYSIFPHLNAGGVIAIEDIHGAHYLESFFDPLAAYLGPKPEVASLHLYPYIMVVQKTGSEVYDPTQLPGAHTGATVSSVEDLSLQLKNTSNAGSNVVLERAEWGRFINPDGLKHFFTEFIGLHAAVAMPDDPPGCATTSASLCTYGTTNSEMQSMAYGVHILPTKLVVEIPQKTPVIEAVRHGNEWIMYSEGGAHHEIS